MMAVIQKIGLFSPFFSKLHKGDVLLKVNGKPVFDFLDYTYLVQDGISSVSVRRCEKELEFKLKRPCFRPELTFDSDLMDQERVCKNKCIFCFIDQLPPDMRKTVYYKDDDFRLSLLFGNYVTLTNLSENDVQRICRMKISPLNVSVHTTNPDLRVKMLKNPNAANINDLLSRFANAGISLRCQIVLCPTYNDGEELTRTLNDLSPLVPSVSSVSIVPFGMTQYREGLTPLRVFTKEESKNVIRQIESAAKACYEKHGTYVFYASDEFYCTAGLPIPSADYYENKEQYENGVGMLADYTEEFNRRLSNQTIFRGQKRNVCLITGKITEAYFNDLISRLKPFFPDLNFTVRGIRNDFFGEHITVTGLITGQDIIKQTEDSPSDEILILPDIMLREDRFLDDISLNDLCNQTKKEIRVTSSEPDSLFNTLEQLCKE